MPRTLLLVILTSLCCAVILHGRSVERQLLRQDPDQLPHNAALMSFATQRGGPVYEAHCAGCHGDGRGNSAKGIPNLADAEWLYGSGQVSDIERIIYYGIRAHDHRGWSLAIMPAFARARPGAADSIIPPLTPKDIDDLVEFLLHRQGRSADAAAAARGSSLFAGNGGCYDCHAPDARGDSAIGAPNLIDGVTLYGDGGRESLFESIAYGRQGVCPAWSDRLEPIAIREVALYVYELSKKGSANGE